MCDHYRQLAGVELALGGELGYWGSRYSFYLLRQILREGRSRKGEVKIAPRKPKQVQGNSQWTSCYEEACSNNLTTQIIANDAEIDVIWISGKRG